MANPLKSILSIRKQEVPLALLMFSYFFLVITVFWILKPIKKGLFIDFYKQAGAFELLSWQLKGSQAELLAKVLNMVVAFAAVMVFTWLARSMRRQQLTYAFSAFLAMCLLLYAFTLSEPAELTIWTFYLFGDLFNTLMVATFFAFLNDSVAPQSAKRLYGPIVLGGVSGGAFGSLFVRLQVESLTPQQWMWICIGLTALIVTVAGAAGRIVDRDPPEANPKPGSSDGGSKTNVAIEGARLVAASRYLVAIVAIVGLYEIVSTILDFQFTATVERYVDDTTVHFSTMGVITNVFALLVQLFLTSFIMTRFGLAAALLVMPIAILGSSGAFLAVPTLWTGSSLTTADNGLNYSLNQSAREALYTPTTRDEKYKAKAFIDMFVQRAAKAVAVGISLLMTMLFTHPSASDPSKLVLDFAGVRWLSLVTVAVTVVWVFAARYAGRRFREMTEEAPPSIDRR
jgi:AAA family ATP:ADP antiporter